MSNKDVPNFSEYHKSWVLLGFYYLTELLLMINRRWKVLLTSSAKHPRVFVLTHSIKRSAIEQKTRKFPLVASTSPTASTATQLRTVTGSAEKRNANWRSEKAEGVSVDEVLLSKTHSARMKTKRFRKTKKQFWKFIVVRRIEKWIDDRNRTTTIYLCNSSFCCLLRLDLTSRRVSFVQQNNIESNSITKSFSDWTRRFYSTNDVGFSVARRLAAVFHHRCRKSNDRFLFKTREKQNLWLDFSSSFSSHFSSLYVIKIVVNDRFWSPSFVPFHWSSLCWLLVYYRRILFSFHLWNIQTERTK